MAFIASHSASTANSPWNAYPGHILGLSPETLLRNTSAMQYAIQTNPRSQATTAPIHHHILLTSSSLSILVDINGFRMARATGPLDLKPRGADHHHLAPGGVRLSEQCQPGRVVSQDAGHASQLPGFGRDHHLWIVLQVEQVVRSAWNQHVEAKVYRFTRKDAGLDARRAMRGQGRGLGGGQSLRDSLAQMVEHRAPPLFIGRSAERTNRHLMLLSPGFTLQQNADLRTMPIA